VKLRAARRVSSSEVSQLRRQVQREEELEVERPQPLLVGALELSSPFLRAIRRDRCLPE
jgi:hypothetical protein